MSSPVRLGKRTPHKPKNAPRIKPFDVIMFVRDFATVHPHVFTLIKDRVNKEDGRPRQLSVETLIGAGIAASVSGKTLIRDIAALLRGLDAGQQRVLDVRWVPRNGGGEQLITERQVEYLFGEVFAAFNDADHDHPVIVDEFILEAGGTGVIVAPVDEATEDQVVKTVCTDACPAWWTMERLGNHLLAGLSEHLGIPRSDKYAVDSYVIETHYATKSWGAVADIDPDWVPDDEKHRVGATEVREVKAGAGLRGRKPKGGPKANKGTLAAVKRAKEAEAARLREEAEDEARAAAIAADPNAARRTRRIPKVGPVVTGDKITSYSPNFPQLNLETGRLSHTKDHGAANAFIGAGGSRPSAIRNGRDKHTVVSSGFLPDGTTMPPFLRAYRCVPGGDNKAAAAITALDYATEFGITPTIVSLDRIYTAATVEKFEHVARDKGWTVVKDLKDVQRGNVHHEAGIEYIDGWWFTDGIQPGLLDIPRPPRNATKAVRVASQARFDARRPFAFRANGKTKAGNLRLRGPAVPDAVEKDANGRVTSVRGMRVRCVNAPYYRFASRSLPLTKCVRGTACGCSKTITITNEDHLNSMEPLLWGSTKWANEYHRRNLVEAFNAREEFHQGVGRHSIRVRAESWDFAHALLTAGTLISMFHAWLMRLGAHALDPAVVNVFTEPVIRACLVVVGITLNRWESPPRE